MFTLWVMVIYQYFNIIKDGDCLLCLCAPQYLAHISICSILNRYLLNSCYKPGTAKSQTNSFWLNNCSCFPFKCWHEPIWQSTELSYLSEMAPKLLWLISCSFVCLFLTWLTLLSLVSLFKKRTIFLSFENDETFIFKASLCKLLVWNITASYLIVQFKY